MTRIRDIKTNFTAGEISRDLLGRGDLRAYDNGALSLQNVFIKPTGGVSRRAGLGYVDTAAGAGRLSPFDFNTQQTYLLFITDAQIAIYAGGVLETTLTAPWSASQIDNLAYTQSADTLLLVHPQEAPQTLTRNSGGTWTLAEWSFFSDDNVSYQPFFKFANTDVTLSPSGTSGTITITASEAVFTANHENTRLKIGGKQLEITDFDSPTVVTATVMETLISASATIDWQEQAFSPARGSIGLRHLKP